MIRALVTGGASPLGTAISRRLAADGCFVYVHAHTGVAQAEALAREISGAAVTCDLGDFAAAAAAMAGVLEGGAVQVVVHNAGVHDDVVMAGMGPAQWRGPLRVGLDGFYAAVQPLLLPMIGTRWGRVIAVSSVTALLGNRGQVAYGAAKAGLIGAVKSLSREVASRGVTANVVAPGVIESPAVAAAMSKEQIAAAVPMKRAGRAEEVAELVGFLASAKSGYISGQVIAIDGGMT